MNASQEPNVSLIWILGALYLVTDSITWSIVFPRLGPSKLISAAYKCKVQSSRIAFAHLSMSREHRKSCAQMTTLSAAAEMPMYVYVVVSLRASMIGVRQSTVKHRNVER